MLRQGTTTSSWSRKWWNEAFHARRGQGCEKRGHLMCLACLEAELWLANQAQPADNNEPVPVADRMPPAKTDLGAFTCEDTSSE